MNVQTFTRPAHYAKKVVTDNKAWSAIIVAAFTFLTAILPLYTGRTADRKATAETTVSNNATHSELTEAQGKIVDRWVDYQDERMEDKAEVAELKALVNLLLKMNHLPVISEVSTKENP